MSDTPGVPPRSEVTGAPKRSLLSDLLDAVKHGPTPLVIGVLVIQFAFVLSYVGAFHHPGAHRVPIAVVAPAEISGHLVNELNEIHGRPLNATAVASESASRTLLRNGSTSGVLIVSPAGKTDALLVASGGGAATATVVEAVVAAAEAAQHRVATVTDAVPAQSGDARGLSGFYLVVGWLVGGYLIATMLGMAISARPAAVRRARVRLIVLVPYAIVSGLGGAIVVDPILGALTGHFLAIAATGFLLVYCAAAVTVGFQSLLGSAGVGLTLLLFVVLGNPSAGGAYQAPLLPGFWRTISPALPNGAGVTALRRIVYFGSHGIASNLTIIAAYIVAGLAMTLVGTAVLTRRASTEQPGASAEVEWPIDAATSVIAPVPGAIAGVRATALPPPSTS